jgi:transcriptional regulator with XRE-family HTH domain
MDNENESASHAITAVQLRAARALLDWSRSETARFCGVGVNTLSRFEKEGRTPTGRVLREVARVFEEHGVIFIQDQRGRGVLLTSGELS